MTDHISELLRAHDEVLGALGESYHHASAQAYRKRTAVYSVSMDTVTHDAISEAYQAWAEYRASKAVGVNRFAPERLPDGRARGVETVYGYPVYVDDSVDRISWDTGPEPAFTFDTSRTGVDA